MLLFRCGPLSSDDSVAPTVLTCRSSPASRTKGCRMAKRSNKSGTANRGEPQQGTPAGAVDDKIARLKALRLARDGGTPLPNATFKRAARRASDPGKNVVLST